MKVKCFLAATLAAALAFSLTTTSAFAAAETYTVKKGDNLSRIAVQQLGSASKWIDIFEANRDSIKDPNLIYAGQILNIPGKEQTDMQPSEHLAGWKSAPLTYTGTMFEVSGGTFSWNPGTYEWRAIYPTTYGNTILSGTYAADGTLTLMEDSTGGFAGNDVPIIQESVFVPLLAGWEGIPLSFNGSMFEVTGGTFFWNPKTSEWQANYATIYGVTNLSGTFVADGTLTLVKDSSGGFASDDVPTIQSVFQETLAGWRSAPLSYSGSMFEVTGGTFAWNSKTMEWNASYTTVYGVTELAGTYLADGTLTILKDSSGGFAGSDLPAIQTVFVDVLNGKYQVAAANTVEPLPNVEDMPGNADEYLLTKVKPMKNSPLKGINLCVLGSSVVEGAGSMEEAVGEYFAARFDCSLTKEAVGGTTLTDGDETSYVQRMLKNLDPKADFDLFICQLSTNDATQKKPLGEISDSKDLDDFDTSTVTGAMEYIICYAQQTWGCPVVFFTGSHYNSDGYDAMVDRLLELREKWEIGVLNLWDDEQFNDISDEDRALYMRDNIHPTKAGYRDWWGPELEQQLLDYLDK